MKNSADQGGVLSTEDEGQGRWHPPRLENSS